MRKILIIIIFAITACKKHGSSEYNNTPLVEVTPIDHNITTALVKKAIESKIVSILNGETADFASVLKEIRSISGVRSAELSKAKTNITIREVNNRVFNYILTPRNDQRLFTAFSLKNSYIIQNTKTELLSNLNKTAGINTSNDKLAKKVLIIAPFQWQFQEPLEDYKKMLENIGISTKILRDQEVTLSVFKNSFLQDFDFIYISTHGSSELTVGDTANNTGLATGVIFDPDKFDALPKEESSLLGVIGISGLKEEYITITSHYLKKFNSKRFNSSFIFANACGSFVNDDLANYFKSNGASEFAGFTDAISGPLSNFIGAKIFTSMALGWDGYNSTRVNDGVLNEISQKHKITDRTIDAYLLKYVPFGSGSFSFSSFYNVGVTFRPGYGYNGTKILAEVRYFNDDDVENHSNYYVHNKNTSVRVRPFSIGSSLELQSCTNPDPYYYYFVTCTQYLFKGNLNFNKLDKPCPILYSVDILERNNLKELGVGMYLYLGGG